MAPKQIKRSSRFLSLVLRHQPDIIGLVLDNQGWANVNMLLEALNKNGHPISLAQLQEIVAGNNKRRFAFNEQGDKIRANQGHSIKIDHGYTPTPPPDQLYHGTATRFLDSILTSGLQKQQRHHVHLSADLATATQVGKRHGKLVILLIDCSAMVTDGFQFFRSENDVWLTDEVPPQYLSVLA